MSLFILHPHGFSLVTYIQHLVFDGAADAGGWYAYSFCKHRWHRISIAVGFALITTLGLVTLVG